MKVHTSMQAPAPQQATPASTQAAVKRARSSGSHKKAVPAPSEAAISAAKSSVARINDERDDKLWIRNSDPYQEVESSANVLPLDFQKILQGSVVNAGLKPDDLTPTFANALLEHARLYAWHLVADAQDFAMHRTSSLNPQITGPDLLMAAQNQSDRTSLQRDRHTAFHEEEVNLVPLPRFPQDCYTGVVLPPLEHTLLARTYDIVPGTIAPSSTAKGSKERPSAPPKKRRSSKAKIEVKLASISSATTSIENKNTSRTSDIDATSAGVKRKSDELVGNN